MKISLVLTLIDVKFNRQEDLSTVFEQDETSSRASATASEKQQQQHQPQPHPPPPKRGEEFDRTKSGKDETPDKTDEEGEDGNQSKESVGTNAAAGGKHSTASGSVELRTSWFNFAAPPKTPISRKIDFTRLDWNLLSTASPSIDAWLGPIDR